MTIKQEATTPQPCMQTWSPAMLTSSPQALFRQRCGTDVCGSIAAQHNSFFENHDQFQVDIRIHRDRETAQSSSTLGYLADN